MSNVKYTNFSCLAKPSLNVSGIDRATSLGQICDSTYILSTMVREDFAVLEHRKNQMEQICEEFFRTIAEHEEREKIRLMVQSALAGAQL